MLNVEYDEDLQTATFIGTQSAAIQRSWCQLYDAITRNIFLHFKKKESDKIAYYRGENKGKGTCLPACPRL